MDTRNKITTLEAAAQYGKEPRGLVAVVAYFDVLQAWHVAELQAVKQRAASLAAVVLPRENALLAQRARAELVAALRMVDYVLTPDEGDLDRLLAQLNPTEIVRLDELDLRRRSELIQHVKRRHGR